MTDEQTPLEGGSRFEHELPPGAPDVPVISVPMMMGSVEQRYTVERTKTTEGEPCVLLWVNLPMATVCVLLGVEGAKNLGRELTEKGLGITIAEAAVDAFRFDQGNGDGNVLRLPGT